MSKTIESQPVSAFMTEKPMTAELELTLHDAQQRMFHNNIRHLIILDQGELVGVLSQRDISVMLSLPDIDPEKTHLSTAAVHDPHACGPDTPLETVARAMEAGHYGCTVIVDEEKAVGIFTTTDALRAIRSLIAGEHVSRETSPSHDDEHAEHTKGVRNRVRASDSVSMRRQKIFGA